MQVVKKKWKYATLIFTISIFLFANLISIIGNNSSSVQADDLNVHPYVAEGGATNYRSPIDVVGSVTDGLIYVADETNCTVEIIENSSGTLVNEFAVSQKPNTLLISKDGAYLYVATGGAEGKVEVFNRSSLIKTAEVSVGHTPSALAQSEDGNVLYVANRFNGTVQTIALENGNVRQGTTATDGIYLTREPISTAVKGNKLYVAGHLPTGNMNDGNVSSEIVVFNTENGSVSKVITMANGSTNVKDIVLSPDGQYLYVSHALGRWNVATTHVDRGWIYTNAVTEIETTSDTVRATMLVDDLELGSANPWGIDVSNDLIVLSISGTKQLIVLNRQGLRSKIEKVYNHEIGGNGYLENPEDISVDLTFTTEYKTRVNLGEDGPRGIELIGNVVYTANYYSGSISRYDVSNSSLKTIKLATSKQEDNARAGERLWNDATLCSGQWLSCASCHPDGRTDALNWDNLNDGVGTPKQARSMVGAWERGRVMATGVRESAMVANRAGVKYILFNNNMPESEVAKIDAYISSLTAEVSPYLVNGYLSDSAVRGKALFEGKGSCATCHSSSIFGQDVLIYENFVDSEIELRGLLVPPLTEVWRTAPYLHDGSASTILDVLTVRNVTGTHGTVSGFTAQELEDLCNYVLSLDGSVTPPSGESTGGGSLNDNGGNNGVVDNNTGESTGDLNGCSCSGSIDSISYTLIIAGALIGLGAIGSVISVAVKKKK